MALMYSEGFYGTNQRSVYDFESSLSQMLSATAAETWDFNPTAAAIRKTELDEAMEGPREMYLFPDVPEAGERTGKADSRTLSPQEAREVVREAGLEEQLRVPEQGIPERALGILIERKQTELARQFHINNAKSTALSTALKLGTGIGVSLLDPLNVAASFVPVVGEARFAAALARTAGAGRAGLRASKGAVEGAVGAVLVEPIVLTAARQEQADYTMVDSLTNIAFGTVMGGGLHMGAGAVKDRMVKHGLWHEATPQGVTAERVAAWSPQEREAAMKIAVADLVEGRKVELDEFAKFRDEASRMRPASLDDARRAVVRDMQEDLEARLSSDAERTLSTRESQMLRAEVKEAGAELARIDKSFSARIKRMEKEGKTRKEAEIAAKEEVKEARKVAENRRATAQEALDKNSLAKAAAKDIKRLRKGRVPERFKPEVDARARQLYQQSGQRRPLAQAVHEAIERGQAPELKAAYESLIARAESLRVSRLADVEQAKADSAQLAENPREAIEELEEALVELEDTAKAQGVEVDRAEITADVEAAQRQTAALRHMAKCQMR